MVLMVAGCYLVRAQAKNDLDVIRLSAGIFAIHFECIMSVYFLRYQCCFPLIIPCAPAIKINIDTKQNMAANSGPSLPSTFYNLHPRSLSQYLRKKARTYLIICIFFLFRICRAEHTASFGCCYCKICLPLDGSYCPVHNR